MMIILIIVILLLYLHLGCFWRVRVFFLVHRILAITVHLESLADQPSQVALDFRELTHAQSTWGMMQIALSLGFLEADRWKRPMGGS